MTDQVTEYRGRIAPTPTGLMHLGHARTFLLAQDRARKANGTLVLRIEDLDRDRCKPEFEAALLDDLNWAGLKWDEGPDVGGGMGPYRQSERHLNFRETWEALSRSGMIFPCYCSRKDVQAAINAPHADGMEPIYPGTCRNRPVESGLEDEALKINWRFRVPDGEVIEFEDQSKGLQRFEAGKDFGDFLIWRKDGIPSYELAVVADDIAMRITEVVRGEDLLLSTARQLLLYRALGVPPPSFYHCPLVCDEQGRRLAKRHRSLSLRAMKASGAKPEDLLGSPIPGMAD